MQCVYGYFTQKRKVFIYALRIKNMKTQEVKFEKQIKGVPEEVQSLALNQEVRIWQ
jgi:hypothetical protein